VLTVESPISLFGSSPIDHNVRPILLPAYFQRNSPQNPKGSEAVPFLVLHRAHYIPFPSGVAPPDSVHSLWLFLQPSDRVPPSPPPFVSRNFLFFFSIELHLPCLFFFFPIPLTFNQPDNSFSAEAPFSVDSPLDTQSEPFFFFPFIFC